MRNTNRFAVGDIIQEYAHRGNPSPIINHFFLLSTTTDRYGEIAFEAYYLEEGRMINNPFQDNFSWAYRKIS